MVLLLFGIITCSCVLIWMISEKPKKLFESDFSPQAVARAFGPVFDAMIISARFDYVRVPWGFDERPGVLKPPTFSCGGHT